MTSASRRRWIPHFGLAARLYLGIGGAVLFTLVASIVAWISFIELGEDQRQITEQQIPAMTRSLRLARQSALIAATAPKLLTVVQDDERRDIMESLEVQRGELFGLIEGLKAAAGTGDASSQVSGRWLDSIDAASQSMAPVLRDLSGIVGDQLMLRERLQDLITQAVAAHRRLTELIVPFLDDATFFMVTGFRSLDDVAPSPWRERVNDEALQKFGALADLAAQSNLLAGLLTETMSVPSVPLLQPLRERFEAAGHRFETSLNTLSQLSSVDRIAAEYRLLAVLGEGPDGIIVLRRDLIERTAEAHQLVDRSRALAVDLTNLVEKVVAEVETGAAATMAESNRSIDLGRKLLLLLTGVSIVGAIVGWVYLRRSFTAPLLRITGAAEAFERQRFEPGTLTTICLRRDELGHLSRVFLRMVDEVQSRTEILYQLVNERARELDVKNAALEQSLKQIDDELAMAQRMQLSILPQRCPVLSTLTMYALMRAAREVGGDFYDIIELDDHRIGVVIADVSGKGVPAALLMAVACTQIKAIAMRAGSPAQVLAELNRTLSQDNESAMFITIFYGIIDHAAGTFVYANGGHTSPYLLREAEPASPFPAMGGVALGLIPDLVYQEKTTGLRSGDTIFFYTDGITDAFNAEGEAFAETRLRDVLHHSRSLSVEAMVSRVLGAIESHGAGAPQSDDITCVVIRYGAPMSADGSEDKSAGDDAERLSMRLRNDLTAIAELANSVDAFGARHELPGKLVFNMNLVLDELLTNIITHGYENGGERAIDVTLERVADGVTLIVEDEAPPFDPLQAKPPSLKSSLEERPIGGLGVHFVMAFMDRVEYQRVSGRNRVTMWKRLDRVRPTGSQGGEE